MGREDTLHIEGESSLCVERIEAQAAKGIPLKLTWKSPKPERLEVAVPLKDAVPGPVNLEIFQYGLKKPDVLALTAYAEAAALDRLSLNAGDAEALLKGNRLDEVAKVSLGEITWTPVSLKRVQDYDQLVLTAKSSTSGLESGKLYVANVQLADGRVLRVPVSVEPRRPQVTLLSKGTQDEASATPSPVHLGSPDDLPLERRLVFFLRTSVPENFPRDEKVEVAAADGSFHTLLGLADGSLMLEDAKTAAGDGGTAGPIRLIGLRSAASARAVGGRGRRRLAAAGNAGAAARLQGTALSAIGWPRPCTLTATNLFLATSIAATPDFDNATDVPPEFTGTQLSVPHPVNGMLYLKLRDDPGTVQTLSLPVMPMSLAAASAVQARSAASAAQAPAKTEP